MKIAKTNNTNNQNNALLVNAEPKDVLQLRQDLPDWLWIEAPKGWPFIKETEPLAQAFQVIIIFAKRGTETCALGVCKHVLEEQMLYGVPLLLAGSRYQMSLSNVVKRLPQVDFIFTPIEEKALLNKIKKRQT